MSEPRPATASPRRGAHARPHARSRDLASRATWRILQARQHFVHIGLALVLSQLRVRNDAEMLPLTQRRRFLAAHCSRRIEQPAVLVEHDDVADGNVHPHVRAAAQRGQGDHDAEPAAGGARGKSHEHDRPSQTGSRTTRAGGLRLRAMTMHSSPCAGPRPAWSWPGRRPVLRRTRPAPRSSRTVG